MIDVREYCDGQGRSPFGRWFNRLKVEPAAWVLTVITRIEEDANFGDSKSVGRGVSELRINKGPGYRVYYGMDGEKMVILGARTIHGIDGISLDL